MIGNPDTPPIGRQPFMARITPSKPYPWYGTIPNSTGNERTPERHADTARVGGDRFTSEQLVAMINKRLDPGSVETMMVKRQATNREIYYGLSLPPVFAMECPVLKREGQTVTVISPSGDAMRVRDDGWVKEPRTRARQGW